MLNYFFAYLPAFFFLLVLSFYFIVLVLYLNNQILLVWIRLLIIVDWLQSWRYNTFEVNCNFNQLKYWVAINLRKKQIFENKLYLLIIALYLPKHLQVFLLSNESLHFKVIIVLFFINLIEYLIKHFYKVKWLALFLLKIFFSIMNLFHLLLMELAYINYLFY